MLNQRSLSYNYRGKSNSCCFIVEKTSAALLLVPSLSTVFTSHVHSVKNKTACEYSFFHTSDFTVPNKVSSCNSILMLEIGNIVVMVFDQWTTMKWLCSIYYDIGPVIERKRDASECSCAPASREGLFIKMDGPCVLAMMQIGSGSLFLL